jgi:hypothetical protein
MTIKMSIQEVKELINWRNDRCFECCRKYNGQPWKQDCQTCKWQKTFERRIMAIQKKEYEDKED